MNEQDELAAQGARLRLARLQMGFRNAKDAAQSVGVKEGTYRTHESGKRGLEQYAATYAEHFEVTVEWLVFGREKISGDAPPRGRAHKASSHSAPPTQRRMDSIKETVLTRQIEEFNVFVIDNVEGRALWAEQSVKLPSGIPRVTAAFRIQGNALRPAYDDGNILLFWNREEEPSRCVGADCAVSVLNGPVLLAKLERGTTGDTWDLLSVSGPVRLMKEARIKWAAAIEVTLRNDDWILPLTVSKPKPEPAEEPKAEMD